MSFAGPGKQVTVNYWVTEVQKSGIGNTDTPDVDERRTFIEDNKYIIKFWNGTEWTKANVMTSAEILATLSGVSGTGSGLDCDMLEGQHGSYYKNANNINAGELSLDRIPDVLTGKDSDTLDSNHGSFYQNASNLNSGTVSRDRLGDIMCCNDDGNTDHPFIQFGTAKIFSPVASPHTFTYAFTNSVSVVATSTTLSKFCSVITTSTTNFSIRHGTDNGYANWIAIGEKI